MSANWHQKLISFGLEEKDGSLVFPGEVTASDVLCTLSSDTIVQVSGDDAEAFLHTQFSNDIRTLEEPGSQLSTWSSLKGRVIVLFRVIRIEGGFLIKLPAALREPVLKRLQMLARLPVDKDVFVMPKVEVEPREDLIAIGVSGLSAEKSLTDAGGTVGQQPDETTALSDAWITRVRGELPRFEVIGTVDKVAEIWSACMQGCEMVDESAWRLQNIDAGIPSVDEKTTEAFVLQMLNLHRIDGVSFTKGCFPGQEVVARMQYLGKLKRQMFRLSYSDDVVPQSGSEVFKAGGGSAVGKVVDAVGESACRLLAVVAIDATEEPLFLDKEGKQALQLLELPYSLAPAE